MKTFKLIRNGSVLGVLFLSFFLVSHSTFAQKKEKGRIVEISGLNNMTFDVTDIEAKPGELLTIRFTSKSKYTPRQMSHNFVLLKQTVNVQAFIDASEKSAVNDFIDPTREDEVLAHTPMAAGGETVEVTFRAPERPSKYMYVCTFPGHFFAGMKGTLTVKE